MCIGIPMQVIESGFGYARCQGMGMTREVETLLVGDQPAGTWLLVFLNSAREVLSADDAEKISAAVQAVDLVMQQPDASTVDLKALDALFADLIDHEPQKPASLIALEQSREKTPDRG